MPENSPRRKPGDKNVVNSVQPATGGRKTGKSYARHSAGWVRPAIPLTPGSRRELHRHVLANPDCEVCGFVYEDGYIPLTNLAKDSRTFIADPAEVAMALAHHGEPLAIFHSHPNGNSNPSEKDLQLASYYNNSTILIGRIVDGKLELFQVVAPPQLEPEPAVQP